MKHRRMAKRAKIGGRRWTLPLVIHGSDGAEQKLWHGSHMSTRDQTVARI